MGIRKTRLIRPRPRCGPCDGWTRRRSFGGGAKACLAPPSRIWDRTQPGAFHLPAHAFALDIHPSPCGARGRGRGRRGSGPWDVLCDSDGTVGISLPSADDDRPLEYTVIAELRFDGQHVVWEEGPFEAQPGEYVPWTIDIPVGAQFEDDQFDYLSDLVVTVQLLCSDLGYESTSAGYARIAFDWGGGPLVLLPDEARVLAPGDAWNPDAPARVERVDRADVPRPPPPQDPDRGPHSEEVDR